MKNKQSDTTPTPIKDILSKAGINLEDIRKSYYENKGERSVIESNKEYIEINCKHETISIWDLVRDTMSETEQNALISAYQKEMTNASLLLAWEELERDDFKLCAELWANSRKNIN